MPAKTKLPYPISLRIRQMIMRVRLVQLARGLCATFAVGLIATMTVMAIDLSFPFMPDQARLVASILALAATAAAFWLAVVRPLCDPISTVRMARILETRHPDLHERISSAIELMAIGGEEADAGSRELLSMLVSDASSDISSIVVNEEFKGTTLRPVAVAACSALAVLLAAMAVFPSTTARLLIRAVAPRAPVGNVASIGLEVSPGDATVIVGSSLEFTLTADSDKHGERAEIIINRPGKPQAVERLFRVSNGNASGSQVFKLRLSPISESFSYRMRFGNALTRRHDVTALPAPDVTAIVLDLQPPPYTGLEPLHVETNRLPVITAPFGTVATMKAEFNRELSAQLRFGSRILHPYGDHQPAIGAAFDWTLSTNSIFSWSLLLRDSLGFTNLTESVPYNVIPDFSPDVKLLFPTGNAYVLPANAHLETRFSIGDDHAVSACKICILPDNDIAPWILECEPIPSGAKRWEVVKDIALGDFMLAGYRQLKLWLEVEDDLPASLGGPNKSRSRIIAININNSENRSLADQVRVPERDEIKSALNDAARHVQDAAQKLERALAVQNEEKSLELVEEALGLAEKAYDKANEAAETAQDGLFAKLADPLADLGDGIDEAIEQISSDTFSDEQRRERAIRDSVESFNRLLAESENLLRDVDELDSQLERIAKLDSLAKEQESLAREAESRQLSNPELDDWRRRQESLGRRFENLSFDKEETKGVRNATQDALNLIDEAKSAPKDEKELKAVRELENAARALLAAAEGRAKGESLKKAVAADSEAIAKIAENADAIEKRAESIADEALQVRLAELESVLERPSPTAAMASELADKARRIASMASQPMSEANSPDGEKISAMADEILSRAEQLSQSPDPFARASAEASERAAKAAEDGNSSLAGQEAEEASRNAAMAALPSREQAREASLASKDSFQKASSLLDRLGTALSEENAEADSQEKAAELARIAEEADATIRAARQASRDAINAEASARPKRQDTSVRAAQAAKTLADDAVKMAESTKKAAENAMLAALSDGLGQSDGQNADQAAAKAAEAARKDFERGRSAAEEAKNHLGAAALETVGKSAAEHAIDAAAAATTAAELAAGLSRNIIPEPHGKEPSGGNPDEIREALGRKIEEARRSAESAAALSRDAGENLSQEAAQAAQQAASFAESAMRAYDSFKDPKGNPPPNEVQLSTQANSAAEKAASAAERAVGLARAAALSPEELQAAVEDGLNARRRELADIAKSVGETAKLLNAESTPQPPDAENGEAIRADAIDRLNALHDKANQSASDAEEYLRMADKMLESARRAANMQKIAAEERLHRDGIPMPADIAAANIKTSRDELGKLPALARKIAGAAHDAKDFPARHQDELAEAMRSLSPELQHDSGVAASGQQAALDSSPDMSSAVPDSSRAQAARAADAPANGTSKEIENLLHALGEADALANDAASALSEGNAAFAGEAAGNSAESARDVARRARSLQDNRSERAANFEAQAEKSANDAARRASGLLNANGQLPTDFVPMANEIRDAASGRLPQGDAAETAQNAIAATMEAQSPSSAQKSAAMQARTAAREMSAIAASAAEASGIGRNHPNGGANGATRPNAHGRKRKNPAGRSESGADAKSDEDAGDPNDTDRDYADSETQDSPSLEMPEWLRRIGFPLSEWLKYKGKADSGLPDDALEHVPRGYREMVKEYFKLLSTEK